MAKAILIFVLCAICEVGGGYLVWIWIKDGKGVALGMLGLIALALYGIVATFQVEGFGRVYAAYGGVFVVFSLLWAIAFDRFKLDMWDILGSIIALCGVWIIMLAPHK